MELSQLTSISNLVLNETYAKCYYSDETRIYVIIWSGVFSDDEYANVFETLLKFAEINKVIGVLSDVRDQGKVSAESRNYFSNYVSPKGDALGIQKVAIITENSVFKRFYLNTIMKFSGKRAQIFTSYSEGIDYLLDV